MVGNPHPKSADLNFKLCMDSLRYGRHFLLLTGSSVLLGVLDKLQPPGGLVVAWALYGALHAAALAGSLRFSRPLWKACLFAVIAAALTVAAARAGIAGRQLLAALPDDVGLYAALGISATSGAAAYGVSIRLFGFYPMNAASIATISIGCTLAASTTLFMVTHFRLLGSWCLVVSWWYAYSAGLWYWDRRRRTRSLPRGCHGLPRRGRQSGRDAARL